MRLQLNGIFGAPEKNLINLGKAKTKFCLSFQCNADNNYLFVNEKQIFKLKADNKNINFPTQCFT